MSKKQNTKPQIKQTDRSPMSLYELSRWSALYDAVSIVAEKCHERRIDFDSFELKPLDILKYVDHASDEIFNRITTT